MDLPLVGEVLPDGSYLSVVFDPNLEAAGRERILAAARAGDVLDGAPRARLVRVVEYDVSDRARPKPRS